MSHLPIKGFCCVKHCRGLIERGRQSSESGDTGVFSIPGPIFTAVNYSNDQQGDSAHPGQDPILPEGEEEGKDKETQSGELIE